MEISLLLRLLIAHLLTDFILQPKSWVADRELKKGKSGKLYLHILVTTLVAYLLSGKYDNWVIPAVIFSTHLTIDYIKSRVEKDHFGYFIADQIAHILVIVLLWLGFENNWSIWTQLLRELSENNDFWLITVGYLFVSWPLGIIIGKATQKWRDQISREKAVTAENGGDPKFNPEEQELGLANAGKWIGICERMLILTFVLMAQYTAIGFLMTAKSILRFSEKEVNTQLKTEYILVGTLVSFTSSALIGVLVNLLR